MSQQRYLQQFRSNIQPNKETAISAIKSQLQKLNDGSFILGRYLDNTNGVRTIIGVSVKVPGYNPYMSLYEVDSIESEALQERLNTIEHTVGIGEGSEGTVSIVDRVQELETIANILTSDKTNTNSVAYKIYESELKLIGDKITDTEVSNTIEGAKKYADKAIELALADNGSIEKAIEIAAAAATTKVVVGTDPNNVMSISKITNLDNSTTYEISLADIAVQSEVEEVKEFIGMTEGGEGSTSVIERIETVDTRITTEVQTLNEKITKNEDAITVLNGTGDGSVKKTVSDAITELVNGADTAYDTLKEIADWIQNDTTGAAKMANDIENLNKVTGGFTGENAIKNAIEDHIDNAASESVEGHTKLVSGDVSNKVYADGEAAAASHNHDNTYSKLDHKHVSDDITDAVSALTGCTSGSTKLVEGNAVYELKTQVEGISEDYLNDIKVTSYNNTVTVSIAEHIATIDVTNMTIDGGEY